MSVVLTLLDDKLLTGLNSRVYKSNDSELCLGALDGFISVKIFVDYRALAHVDSKIEKFVGCK